MTYKTIAGDTFDLISYKTLGSCRYTQVLIDANREHVETYEFDAGVELKIPEITTEPKAKKLPPWRK